MATDPARVIAAAKRVQKRNEIRKAVSPAVMQYQDMIGGYRTGDPLPRDPLQFLAGTFTPLTPIEPVPVNVPEGDEDRPGPRQREMPVGWNMPIGVPGSEGFKLASFGTLRMYADIYSVARACIQLRKNEIRGLEWDILPTKEAEKKMRGDAAAHRDFAERRAKMVRFFRKPDPDYLSFGSYIDALVEEMLVTDALSLFIHPTRKSGAGPFGTSVAALEIISGATIRPLVNTRGGRVAPPSPGYQQYLYGVPRVDLMQILAGRDEDELKDLGKPVKEYRGDQLMYIPYTQRSWTPYGFPPLERTLIPTITGLRKQQFQMDFFDEGTIPGNYISPGENVGWTPNQLQIWQNQQNALAGDPAWKHKSIALPPGSRVFPMKPIEIADQADEVIMTQVCMGYDVEPMELGVSPKVSATQSTGAAHQMAKASQDKQVRKSTKPTLAFLTDIFNVIIQDVWEQTDARFVFEGLEEDEDENSLVERLVQMLSFGLAPIDECRIALGKPPYGLPITSDPVFVSATAGMVPLGSIDPTTGKPMGTPPPAAVGGPPPGPGGPGSPPGAPGKPPGPSAPGSPPKALPGASPAQDGATPPGQPPAKPGHQPPALKPDPGDKVGNARQAATEAHALVQQQMHEDFQAGKPLEPPVRPPVTATDQDPAQPVSTKAILAELDALRRHTGKGRDPATWKSRHLPDLITDHYASLLKMLEPNDAYAVTREFVISCFGPPVVESKVLSTTSPVDSTGGKQGLAPYDLDGGERPIQQSYPLCDCGHHHAQGTPCPECKCSHGEEVDGSWAVKGSMNAGPKVSGLATRAWPAWKYDLQVKDHYAGRLQAELRHGDTHGLVREWLESQAGTKASPLSGAAQDAWSWLIARGFARWLQQTVQRILSDLWAEGFAIGRESAREMLDSAYDSEYWNDWTPGDVTAARLVAGDGLQRLLDDYGIRTIKSVSETRMHDLANALAEGFEDGDSPDSIAERIEQILIVPQRARMIAGTELARAVTQASVGEYRKANQDAKRWSGTPDDRICPRCAANVEEGIIPIDHAFASGDVFTPGHPECRCAILPEELPAAESGFPLLPVIKREKLSPAEVHLRDFTVAGRSCSTCSMMRGSMCDFGFRVLPDQTCDRWLARPVTKSADLMAGGLCVRAKDTGRVLMIQRAHDDDDPAGGYWEFPGGRMDDGEDVEGAARREWAEETGLDVPPGRVVSTWEQGVYRGHVLPVDSEDACPILDREKGANPDDPKNRQPEAVAWWDPAELKDNPAIRPELRKHPKRVRRAIEATGDSIKKYLEIEEYNALSDRIAGMFYKGGDVGGAVYRQLSQNYPPDSIEWVKRAKWAGPYLVPWSKIDHDDMDKWAASHQPDRVEHFAKRIEAGDEPGPVVLVIDPDGNHIDVDGHHRALAYHKLGRPVRAWIGKIDPADRHAMEETHLDQVHEGSDPLNKGFNPLQPRGYHGRWVSSGEHHPSVADDPFRRPGGDYHGLGEYGGDSSERMVTDVMGHRHWGAFGAAGLLIRHRGRDGQMRYLLQRRSPHVHEGGTWSTPGGALHRHESPERGAIREAEEEWGRLPGIAHHQTFTDDHGDWAYHTVIMNARHRFDPEGGGETDWENAGHGWFTADEIARLPLHPGFAATWSKVRSIKTVVPQIVKVGPKGYIHGWIYVGPGNLPDLSIDHPDLGHITLGYADEKVGLISYKDEHGVTHQMVHHHDDVLSHVEAKKPAEPPGKCKDHCGKNTKGGNYLPGHDAKHVGMLAAAVNSGEMDPLSAYSELGHSKKLQDKLAGHIAGAAPVPHIPAPAVQDKPKPVPASDPVNAPGQDLHPYGNTTPDGRAWKNVMVAGGRGSYYQIEERPGTKDTDPFRNQRMRLKYLGDGTVVVQRNPSKDEPDTWVDSTHTTLDMLSQPHRSKVWQVAAKQLRQAEKNEKIAKAAGAFKPKPPPEPPKVAEAAKPAAPKIKPPKQDLESKSGALSTGRTWTSEMTDGGVGSGVEFGVQDPAYGTSFYTGKEWRVEYLGGKKVEVSYRNASGQWDSYASSISIQKLGHGMPGAYGAGGDEMTKIAYAEMSRARKNELEVEKHATKTAMAEGGQKWLPVEQTGAAQAKSGTMFNDSSGGAPHMVAQGWVGSAGAAKAKVAYRLAGRMHSPTEDIVAATGGSGLKDVLQTIRDNKEGKLSGTGPPGTKLVLSRKSDGGVAYAYRSGPPLKGEFLADSPEGDRVMREAAVSAVVQRWAVSSNDSDAHSIAMQEAAIHEFGLHGTAPAPAMKHDDPAVLALKKHESVYRDFLRSQYDLTQADMKKHGVTHITLYRGMGWHLGVGSGQMPKWAQDVPMDGLSHEIQMPQFRPLSSWSRSSTTANGFGGQIVLTATIPAESILGYPQSGLGCLSEHEFVVLGNGTGKVKAKRSKGY